MKTSRTCASPNFFKAFSLFRINSHRESLLESPLAHVPQRAIHHQNKVAQP
jgi:hypothetical protein